MGALNHPLCDFFAQNEAVIQLELTDVRGSSPRNVGTVMYVAGDALWGTIGGGQLEFMVIKRAREMLAKSILADHLDIPLGPEIGQCCGGRVKISLARMSRQDKDSACAVAQLTEAKLPHVYVMGAGHVGRALANQFQHLPVQCVLVDTRAEELAQCTANVDTRLSAIPEF
ncbi:XdhC family protein, partial [Falsihalocynthiibacter sp. CO-5D18]|uniref:XdhC family protein n=1 Tax=Falsihalocynthiibacter sp. CO-5D18 TaxID=3240872 RepID=UPI00351015F9